MAWLELDINELREQTETLDKSGFSLLEPNVYEAIIQKVYLDKTQSGTSFVNFIFNINNQEVKIEGWDVNRMFRGKDGNLKNSKGFFNNGVLLLEKITNVALDKDINNLQPKKAYIEVFGQNKEVVQFDEFINKKIVIGLRHRIRYYEKDGELKSITKYEIVNFCKSSDNECIEKMKRKIENNPVLEDKKPEIKSEPTETDDIPF